MEELNLEKLKPKIGTCRSFSEWFAAGVMESKSKQEIESVAMTTWLIWKSRNEEIFYGARRGAKQIISYSQTLLLQEYQALRTKKEASL